MKKILLLALVIFSVVFGYSIAFPNLVSDKEVYQETALTKAPILKVALVADSHNENEFLGKALSQAGEQNVDFVIGLGDYTNLGTVEELEGAKAVFDNSGLEYYVIPGDRDGWASRQQGGVDYFEQIFGQEIRILERENVLFVILDNSEIYSGISQEDWEILDLKLETRNSKLTFVFAHKTPFHPESAHVMGEDSVQVAVQAKKFMDLMETTYPCHSGDDPANAGEDSRIDSGQDSGQARTGVAGMTNSLCPSVDGFFSGDLHFFAQFKSPQQSVKITTIGAVASGRNFQGPRFSILKIFEDWRWEVEDVEIR